ncbi:tetratricopeptide repeat protein [Flavihumibacter sp. CACIAM 22H1]|uniref:tetratricopeptide repeat protein n=1 Tax=Flavihumibacter sp. CACIAM 22H1 TaxID=1812911 RepID=UPI0025C39A48|nr:tetratricopeptide repeat protein [Flavihumibacter sp. CACIAM 22H1]
MAVSAPATTDTGFIRMKNQLDQYRKTDNRLGQANALQEMGQLYFHLGNYTAALQHLLQADKLYRSLTATDQLANNLNQLGLLYYYNQQPDLAWHPFREALDLYKQSGNRAGLAETYGQAGHLYEKQGKYDSAFYFQQLALKEARLSGEPVALAKIYEHLGSILEDRQQYDSAYFYFNLSLNGYRSSGKLVEQIEVINNLGDVVSKGGDPAGGMEYARQAAQLAQQSEEKYQLQSAYRDMAQNFAALHQYDSAYNYLEMSRRLIQEIYAKENAQQVSLLQTIHETDKKNVQIDRLNADRRLHSVLLIASLLVLALLAIVAFLTVNRQKLKIRNEQIVHQQHQQLFLTEKGLMESELQRQQLEEASLKQQLEIKSQELSSHILHLIQKNEVLEEIRNGLQDLVREDKRDHKKALRQLLQKISFSFSQDSYWEEFRIIFDKVHPTLLARLQQQFPTLTQSEMRLLALVKMNMSSADTAKLLGITPDSLRVVRYRVKKKLQLGQEESLSSFVQTLA